MKMNSYIRLCCLAFATFAVSQKTKDDGSVRTGRKTARLCDEYDCITPTRELALMATIGNQSILHELFLSLEVTTENSWTRLSQQQKDSGSSQLQIHGEGIPLFPWFRRRGFFTRWLSSLTRPIWKGKIFNFPGRDGTDDISDFVNLYIGKEFWTGHVYQDTIQGAMARAGEPDPGLSMPEILSPFGKSIVLDEKQSIIFDYGDGDFGNLTHLIDECRPLTEEALSAVSVDIPEDVDVEKLSDTWLCRSSNPKFFKKGRRQFVFFFMIQFDFDSIEIVQ